MEKTIIITDVSHSDVIHYGLYETLSNRADDPEFIFYISPGNLNGFDQQKMTDVINTAPVIHNQPESVRFGRAVMLTMHVGQMASIPNAKNTAWLFIGRAPWLGAVKEMLFDLYGIKAFWLPVLSIAGMDSVFGDPLRYIERIQSLNANAIAQRKRNLTVAELSNLVAKEIPETMTIAWRKKYFGARRMETVFRAAGLSIKGKLVKGLPNKQPASIQSNLEK